MLTPKRIIIGSVSGEKKESYRVTKKMKKVINWFDAKVGLNYYLHQLVGKGRVKKN